MDDHYTKAFEKTPKIDISRRELVTGLACGTIIPFTSSCVTNPETGRSQFVLINENQLSKLAIDSWNTLKKETPISTDERLRSRIERVWHKVAVGANRHNESWELEIFDTDMINAFVMPGNRIGIFKGLIDIIENDDQIATILGHEVGHVTGRHAAERISQALGSQLGLIIANYNLARANVENHREIMAVFGMGIQFGILLPYSRVHEYEADRLGLDYMYRAGYDANQALRIWEIMGDLDNSRPPEFLSTHPDPGNRAEYLQRYIMKRGYDLT